MKNKKIIGAVVGAGILLCVASIEGYHYYKYVKRDKSMIVMNYKPTSKTNENGYSIDKLENIEGVKWINGSKIITLTNKGEFVNPDSKVPVSCCSVYDLNTKTSKDFNEVNIKEIMAISPDGNFIIYQEPKYIPKVGSKEWEKAAETNELFSYSNKLLNLSTGEVSTFKTDFNNSSARFYWIDNSKVLINYYPSWDIVDMNGKVLATGEYKGKKHEGGRISGLDIKDGENGLEGKIYYTQDEIKDNGACNGVTLCSMDVKTKEIKKLLYNKNSLEAIKKGETILIDNFTDHGEISPGVYNRTFGAYVLDENGEILREIEFEKCAGISGLSPDGKYFAYVEWNPLKKEPVKLKVMDIKSGEIKEIFEDKIITNLEWDPTSKALSFTTGNSAASIYKKLDKPIDTYIINFDN